MKVTIIKVSADGEQISVECQVGGDQVKDHMSGRTHLRQALAPAFDLVDARLLEMNKRIMAANYLVRKLSPEGQFAINNVMDVLHGKASGPATEEVLEQAKREYEANRAKAFAESEKHEGAQGAEKKPRLRSVPKDADPIVVAAAEAGEQARLAQIPGSVSE